MKIISVRDVGFERTFDIEVDHPDHQFYMSNGALTSNSHAVAYSLCTFQCAWLLYYHQKDWLCAYIETQLGDADKRANAISTIKSFGYTIGKVDVNASDSMWRIDGSTFVPSFNTVNGIGAAAVDELKMRRPFIDVESMFWGPDGEWAFSKFNKRALDALIRLEAFDSMGIVGPERTFESYKHMHIVMIEHLDELRRGRGPRKERIAGRELFRTIVKETSGCGEWTLNERLRACIELIGDVNVSMIISNDTQKRLNDKGVISIDDVGDGKKEIAWFIAVDAKNMTTKTGKEYQMLFVIGPSGKKHRVRCWGAKHSFKFTMNCSYIAEIDKNEYGMASRIGAIRRLG